MRWRWRSLAVWILPMAMLTACGPNPTPSPTPNAVLDTSGLTKVDIDISAPLPPPYSDRRATLTTQSDLTRFRQEVATHSIALGSYSSGSLYGCAGGATYTLVVIRGAMRAMLTATTCGNAFSANFVGSDLQGFLEDINAMVR